MKKVVKHLTLLMFMLVVMLSITNIASAEAVTGLNVTVDYQSQDIIVEVEKNTTIYYAIDTKEGTPKSWDSIPQSRFTTVTKDGKEQKVAIIDFSYAGNKKDLYVSVKGNATTKVTQITAVKAPVLKAVYGGNSEIISKDDLTAYAAISDVFNKNVGYVKFTTDGTTCVDFANIQWRKGLTTKWESLSTMNLSKFLAKGSTIYFRYSSPDCQTSNPIKVTIAKLANAPAVKVDSSKLTVNMNAKHEYRLSFDDGANYTEWKSVNSTSKALKLSDLSERIGNGYSKVIPDFILEVRLAPTSKKLYSKSSVIKLSASELDASSNPITVEFTAKEVVLKKDIETKYQIAILDTAEDINQVISKLDPFAGAKDTGYVKWINIGNVSQYKISKTKLLSYTNPQIIYRVAPQGKQGTEEFTLPSTVAYLQIEDKVTPGAATPPTSMPIARRWGYSLCNETEKKAYEAIYQALRNFEATLDVSKYGLTTKEAYEIYYRIVYDCPELFHIRTGCSSYMDTNGIALKLQFTYLCTKEEGTAISATINGHYNKIVAGILADNKVSDLSSVDPVVKIKAVRDYLRATNSYAKGDWDQSMYGALSPSQLDKITPVCSSYSKAFSYICNKMDIETYLIVGTLSGGPHAWNLIYLPTPGSSDRTNPNNWYEIDVTNDTDYRYFLKTTAELTKHVKLYKIYSAYPIASATGTYYSK